MRYKEMNDLKSRGNAVGKELKAETNIMYESKYVLVDMIAIALSEIRLVRCCHTVAVHSVVFLVYY